MTTIREQINAITNAKPMQTDAVTAQQARRAARKARKIAAVAKVYVSPQTKLPEHTPEVWADRMRERLEETLNEFLMEANNEMVRFRKRLDEDVYNAFDWSKDAYKMAGVDRACRQLQQALVEIDQKNDGYQGGSNVQTIKWLREWMTNEVQNALHYNDDDRSRLALARGFVKVLDRMKFYWNYAERF